MMAKATNASPPCSLASISCCATNIDAPSCSGPDAARSRSWPVRGRPSRTSAGRAGTGRTTATRGEVDPWRLTQRSVVVLHHDVAPARERVARRFRRRFAGNRLDFERLAELDDRVPRFVEDDAVRFATRDVRSGSPRSRSGSRCCGANSANSCGSGSAPPSGWCVTSAPSTAGRSCASSSSSTGVPVFGDVLDSCDRRLRRVVHDLFDLPPGRTTLRAVQRRRGGDPTDREQHHEARQARARDEEAEARTEVRRRAAGTPTRRTGRSREMVTSTPRIVGSHSVFSPPPCCARNETSACTAHSSVARLRRGAGRDVVGDVSSRPSRSYVTISLIMSSVSISPKPGMRPDPMPPSPYCLFASEPVVMNLLVQREAGVARPEAALGRAVAEVERAAAALPPPPPASPSTSVPSGTVGIEDRPALRVAAGAVQLEQQLTVGDVLTRGVPTNRPFEARFRVLEPGERIEERAARAALARPFLRRHSAARRAPPRARCSRRRARRRSSTRERRAPRPTSRELKPVIPRAPASASSAEVSCSAAWPCAASSASAASACDSSDDNWIDSMNATRSSIVCTFSAPPPGTPNACIGVPGRP